MFGIGLAVFLRGKLGAAHALSILARVAALWIPDACVSPSGSWTLSTVILDVGTVAQSLAALALVSDSKVMKVACVSTNYSMYVVLTLCCFSHRYAGTEVPISHLAIV